MSASTSILIVFTTIFVIGTGAALVAMWWNNRKYK